MRFISDTTAIKNARENKESFVKYSGSCPLGEIRAYYCSDDVCLVSVMNQDIYC